MKYSDEFVLMIFNEDGSREAIAKKHGVSPRWVGKIKDGSLRSTVTGMKKKKVPSRAVVYSVGKIHFLINGIIIYSAEYSSKGHRNRKINWWKKNYVYRSKTKDATATYEFQICPYVSEKELNKIVLPSIEPEATPTYQSCLESNVYDKSHVKFINPKLVVV